MKKQENSIHFPVLNEDEARKYIEALVWENGPMCSHCDSQRVTLLQGKSTRPGVYKCKDCYKQFTVTTGTVFEKTKIPLSVWVMGFHLMCSSKKGISSHQMHRMLGITYKCAWHMTHRIRLAMTQLKTRKSLRGTVEVDETYIGGKEKNKHWDKKLDAGRGSVGKFPVLALVQRNGNVVSKKVEFVNGSTLKGAIKEHVRKDARIITDEFPAYNGIGEDFNGGHEMVNHGGKEYVREDIYTNTVECYFSLLKRGVTGTFHHVSKKHLDRYCHEFDFRWNNRKITDTERREEAIKMVRGKRLVYMNQVELVDCQAA